MVQQSVRAGTVKYLLECLQIWLQQEQRCPEGIVLLIVVTLLVTLSAHILYLWFRAKGTHLE